MFKQSSKLMNRIIKYDFRSDTVTKPTPEMLQSLLQAIVGDDVFEEDPTVNQLQDTMRIMTGKESALFCSSGTLSNQLGIQSCLSCPPYSVLCDRRAHVYVYEASGISFHTGAQVIPIQPQLKHLTLKVIEANWMLDQDIHHAPTQLICLENTLHGEILPIQDMKEIYTAAKHHGIHVHLDGARLWNASMATGISISEYCKYADTISLCFSKGLGAPIGSCLVGPSHILKRARHFRKMYGGGWRQAGILAQACLYSLEHILPKLKIDHENAKLLSKGLQELGYPLVHSVDTNMVWIDVSCKGLNADSLSNILESKGIKTFGGSETIVRFVLHHQIPTQGVYDLLDIFKNI